MHRILFLGVIGALIGWITNILAIKLIFRPLNPVKIPIINFKIVGLIPKRRKEIAYTIGNVVEKELLSVEEIMDKIIQGDDKKRLVKIIKQKILQVVDEKMPPFIPSTFKVMITDYIDKVIEEEAEKMITNLGEELINKASSRIKIAKMVEDKINEFDLEKLEEIILQIARKELKHIEILGAILGLFIGIIQGIIIIYI
ncbi:Protein of unknown function [Alkalithermobacter thermoalcaliphilus JW-YL-7 = DSM 7308]|uniref:DUF445 family protein n=1 Tax=Alkalithermobacter thermoalcaliphilus JW-YL-7 = DSM 7308 TaxID=1121328 RepID=A0A150FP04_CLOPD|nr:protein of unknown function DUF445 [[Clostridium] paradoxum JW-YL-7 = DSM 7308]SHK83519.1 Protein of unknown function [[Clostridium] paradoxum JW-YL-7 = DSM 7308]